MSLCLIFVWCTKVAMHLRQTVKKGEGTYSSWWRNPWQSYGASPVIWDHTVLSATRHRWACPTLTPAMHAGTRFTYPGGMEGWVDLVTRKRRRRESNSRPLGPESNALTTEPPSKQCNGSTKKFTNGMSRATEPTKSSRKSYQSTESGALYSVWQFSQHVKFPDILQTHRSTPPHRLLKIDWKIVFRDGTACYTVVTWPQYSGYS